MAKDRDQIPDLDPDSMSLHDVALAHALKGIASIHQLTHEKQLEHQTEKVATDLFDASLERGIEDIRNETAQNPKDTKPTFAKKNRIITRRQSRRTVTMLMQRANHPTRRYR